MSIEVLIGACVFIGVIWWLYIASTTEVKISKDHDDVAPPKPVEDVKTPDVPKPPLPQTLGDLIKEETPKPEKKPRKPRQKKVPPSPDVLKVYQEPKAAPTEVLDHRLDGFATPPKKVKVDVGTMPVSKVKDHIEKTVEKVKAEKAKPMDVPGAYPFPTSRPDDKLKKVRRPRQKKVK